jgi:hypothetical protein
MYSTSMAAPRADQSSMEEKMKRIELECHDKPIYPTSARKSNFTRFACYALLAATTAFIAVPGMANADSVFIPLNNPTDPMFNQLLGISDDEIIAGYFGDGTAVFNNGYVLVPNTHYSVENFAGTPPTGHTVTQTQAIGINNSVAPVIVGFWADQNGLQFGFEDVKGAFTTVLDPSPAAVGFNQNLLGVNDSNQAAGFWTDSGGHEHGFIVSLTSNPLQFTEIPPARSLTVRSGHRRAASTTGIKSADSGLMPTAMTTAFSVRLGET